MNRNALRVRKHVVTAWNNAVYGLRQMDSASTVRPIQPDQIFVIDDDDTAQHIVKLDVGPVVFHVPERPNRPPNLFIVVKGRLSFEGPDFKSTPLKTNDFATQVAYFRSKSGRLEHVYGAHYDFDDQAGRHPVFHAQLRPRAEFAEHVMTDHPHDAASDNGLRNVLRTVRIPTAQLDVFSVVTQICADHLMDAETESEVIEAFQRTRDACDFILGAAHRIDFLRTPSAAECYRSSHWYGSPQ